MRRIHVLLTASAVAVWTASASAVPFINEFHYDNAGFDTGEFIELAGPAGFDLTGWQLLRYNGANGLLYSTPGANPDLTGRVFSNQSNGFGFIAFDFPQDGIQNGSPDGLALIRPNNTVAQFLSYEGSFVAVNGPAAGMSSTDIGQTEPSDTPVGFSLQLTGTRQNGTAPNFGTQPAGFTWAAPASATKGAVNTGQNFVIGPPPPPPPPPNDVAIAAIQGAGHTSPLVGQAVSTTGIVSQVVTNGYYLMSDRPDANMGTSEGIFVFTGNAGVKPTLGDLVRVNGNVSEFLPGGNANNTTITQLTGSTFSVTSSGNAVMPVTIGASGRQPPVQAIETSTAIGDYDPLNAGRDFYESLEGMLVRIEGATAVAPTVVFSNGNREVWVRSNAPTNSLNARGGLTIAPDGSPMNVQGADFNPERIQIDTFGNNVGPLVNTGDTLGDVIGTVSYDFGAYEIVNTVAPTVQQPSSLARETTSLKGSQRRMTFATYNVENLGNNQSGRYEQLADEIVDALKSPDVIGLQEILAVNDNGQAENIAQTLQGVVNALAARGKTYAFAFLPAQGVLDDRIVNAYLYQPSRVSLVAGSLEYVPGVTAAGSPYDDARGPLVAQFVFNGETITTINNHWSSRGGSQPLFGANQPPANGSEARRQGQGEVLNAYVEQLLSSDPKARIVVGGDLNSFYWENPQVALRQAGGDQVLFGLYELLGLNERYSYNFDGNAQQLDYIYSSLSLYGYDVLYDIVHLNSEFLDQSSDHDPMIASFLVSEPSAGLLIFLGVAGIVSYRRRSARA